MCTYLQLALSPLLEGGLVSGADAKRIKESEWAGDTGLKLRLEDSDGRLDRRGKNQNEDESFNG
jgi:hypothetical protein